MRKAKQHLGKPEKKKKKSESTSAPLFTNANYATIAQVYLRNAEYYLQNAGSIPLNLAV